jgi:hypothetical protein
MLIFLEFMIGYNHALDSSSDEENESSPFDTNVFIKHLRKCFIATDNSSYCEMGILPDLRIFDKLTPE